MANCPLCGAPLAYSGQPYCAACGVDLRARRGQLTTEAATTFVHDAAPALAPAALEAAPALAPAANPAYQAAWSASHWASAVGQPAWTNPDSVSQPEALLPPNVELAVVQTHGDWAQVSARNGWQGWVDARQLVAIPWAMAGWSAASLAAAPAGGTSRRTKVMVILVGVLLVALLVVASVAGVSAPGVAPEWTGSGNTAPLAGHWTGISSGAAGPSGQPGPQGGVLVEFTVVDNSATQVSVSFWDSHDIFYKWNCADADVSGGTFAVSHCVAFDSGTGLDGDVTGTFDESNWLDGEYIITVHGDTYSDGWTGMHF